MKKSDRISSYVATLGEAERPGLHACYLGYFTCFNAGEYYEAHDVLEHLWLQDRTGDADFYKGLIQFAGAFVHLRKQFIRPDHPKDGRRLGPAVRLFRLALGNLRRFTPWRMYLDVAGVVAMGEEWMRQIEASEYRTNPWRPGHGPFLRLQMPNETNAPA